MSYYRSAQAYTSLHEANNNATQPLPASQLRTFRSNTSTTGSQAVDQRSSQLAADASMPAHIAGSWTPPHLARVPTHERSHSDQTYPSGPRATTLNFPSTPPHPPPSNASDATYTPYSQNTSVLPGSYNPQAYAVLDNPGSPTHSGAPHSTFSQTSTPATNQPNAFRRYEPANYQGMTSRVHGVAEGMPGTRHIFGALAQQQYSPQQDSTYSPRPGPEDFQHARYSPQAGNDYLDYHNYGSQSPAIAQNQTSYASSPIVPARNNTRSTPVTQSSHSATLSNHSPSLRSSHGQFYNDFAQSGPQAQPGQSSHLLFEETLRHSHSYSQPHSSSAGSVTQSGVHRAATGRHPQSRPLPGAPSVADTRHSHSHHDDYDNDLYDAEELAQQDLYEQVENSLRTSLGTNARARPDQQALRGFHGQTTTQSFVGASLSPNDNSPAPSSGIRRLDSGAFAGTFQSTGYEEYSDEGDAEAAAGLAAMQMAADEAEQNARRQGGFAYDRIEGIRTPGSSYQSDGDGIDEPVDLSSYEGVDVQLRYGDEQEPMPRYQDSYGQHRSSTWGSGTFMLASDGSNIRRLSGQSTDSPSHGAAFGVPASTDSWGTGGLTYPTGERRRLSFTEGDDYDEQTMPGQPTGGGGPVPSYTPSTLNARPLPPNPPPDSQPYYPTSAASWQPPPWVVSPAYGFPTTPDSYGQVAGNAANVVQVPRSISLTSPPATPQPPLPNRAQTDADQRLRRGRTASSYGADSVMSGQTASSSQLGIDLPTLPAGRRFQPSKLSQRDFDICKEPWALSAVTAWLRAITASDSDVRQQLLADAVQMLFTNKVPNMNIADAEALAAHVVRTLLDVGILGREEEWLKFEEGTVSGVLPQLTGSGCYSLSGHDYELPGRCYTRYCQRTVKRIDVQGEGPRQADDWATFYKLKKENVEGVDKKEIERQNIIHEILTTEQQYLDDLVLLQSIYRDGLSAATPPIITPRRLPDFLKQVFGKLEAVQKANGEFLLPQLRYRQREQGPWISVISDIFRDWIRKAKAAYVEYAANFPQAYHAMKMEEQRNSMFMVFCDQARNHKQARRLGWDTYLKAPITRLQRYGLFLNSVLKNTAAKSEQELLNLQTAIDEIKAVTLECDTRVFENSHKVDLLDIQTKLDLRQEMRNVELNITQRGRELLHRGDLQRQGNARIRWLDTHVILLDNYLILAKIVPDPSGGPRAIRYDVSKHPIPMDLLSLESSDDDPLIKGISGTRSSSVVPGSLQHTNTSLSLTLAETTSSTRPGVANTSLERTEGREEKTLYPFRIKHLGRDTYTLFCSRLEDRRTWCEKIIEAKTKHANSLFRQGAEPFSLRVLADTAFAYDGWTGSNSRRTLIRGTPLSRAIEEVEVKYAKAQRPGPICKARVNCATTFAQQGGRQMIAIGTDYGVYTAEVGDCRNWTRAITLPRVTQLAALEEYNLMLLVADKSLFAYHLDVVCPTSGAAQSANSTRRGPQKLSGSKDVGFFAAGRMKDRTLLFYKKKDGTRSTFRILEPVLQKATERRSRLLHRGNTDFFRDYDEFYIPAECTGLELFASTLAVATSKGFEVLNLDKKTPFSIPDLLQPGVTTIAARLAGVDPVAMFRFNESELICVYEECAIYVNNNGDISRSVVMEFVGRAKAASLVAGYLILFDRDFVEVRDAQLGRLKQVVPGVDVKCLDNGRGGSSGGGGSAATMMGGAVGAGAGGNGTGASAGTGQGAVPRTVKFAMQHPELDRVQIVMELVLNTGLGVGGR